MHYRGSETNGTKPCNNGVGTAGECFLPCYDYRFRSSKNGNMNNNYNCKQNQKHCSFPFFSACNAYDNGYFRQPQHFLPRTKTQEASLTACESSLSPGSRVCANSMAVFSVKPLLSSMRRCDDAALSGSISVHGGNFQAQMNVAPSRHANLRYADDNYQNKKWTKAKRRFFSDFELASHNFYQQQRQRQQQHQHRTMFFKQRQSLMGTSACVGGQKYSDNMHAVTTDRGHVFAKCFPGDVNGFSSQYLEQNNDFLLSKPGSYAFVAEAPHKQCEFLQAYNRDYALLYAQQPRAWNTPAELYCGDGSHVCHSQHTEACTAGGICAPPSEGTPVETADQLHLRDAKRDGRGDENRMSLKQTNEILENKLQEEKEKKIEEDMDFQNNMPSFSCVSQDEKAVSFTLLSSESVNSESSAHASPQAKVSNDCCGTFARLPPQLERNAGRITCCLDLDNTLVYTFTEPPSWWEPENNSLHLEIEFLLPAASDRWGTFYTDDKKSCCDSPNDDVSTTHSTAFFSQHARHNDKVHKTREVFGSNAGSQNICVRHYVCIRPDALEFVAFCIEKFEVVFFTSGTEEYACRIFDHLDPKRAAYRLYRHHCTMCSDGLYRKDLSLLGRPIDNVILFDDRGPDVCFQPQNVLFCEPFILEEVDDAFTVSKTDKELRAYMMFFDVLSGLKKDVIFKAIQMYNDELVKGTEMLLQGAAQPAAVVNAQDEGRCQC